MSTAKISTNLIPVRPSQTRDGYLTVDVPNGWEDVEKIRTKVLEFEGRRFVFTGWNSDRNEAFFKSNVAVARILPS
jgi:hypothetical protein